MHAEAPKSIIPRGASVVACYTRALGPNSIDETTSPCCRSWSRNHGFPHRGAFRQRADSVAAARYRPARSPDRNAAALKPRHRAEGAARRVLHSRIRRPDHHGQLRRRPRRRSATATGSSKPSPRTSQSSARSGEGGSASRARAIVSTNTSGIPARADRRRLPRRVSRSTFSARTSSIRRAICIWSK